VADKCPKCGMGLKSHLGDKYCINKNCKGWYCFVCNKWHHYGTFCSHAQIHGSDVSCQEDYDRWIMEHVDDLRLMLKEAEAE